jgi:hypothetical protein
MLGPAISYAGGKEIYKGDSLYSFYEKGSAA